MRWREVAIPSRYPSGEWPSVQSEVWRYTQRAELTLDDKMVDYDSVPRLTDQSHDAQKLLTEPGSVWASGVIFRYSASIYSGR